MDDVLVALGWPTRPRYRALLVGYIVLLTVAFMFGGYVLARPLGSRMYVVEILLWLPWLFWLGYLFPKHHLRELTASRSTPYRWAFLVHIAPGISWNFAQMARPGLAGIDVGGFAHLHPVPMVVGLGGVAMGCLMIGVALRTIGVSRALFLGEYKESSRLLVTGSIYGWIRHPLFVGGIVISLGIGVFFFSAGPLLIAAANAAVLPVYQILEDARCRKVYNAYQSYQRDVSGAMPTLAQTRRIYHRFKGRL